MPQGELSWPSAYEPIHQIPVGIEDIDEATPRAWDVVFLLRVLQRVGHVKLAVDGRDAEGGVTGRQARVPETGVRADGLKFRIEDVDRAGVKVSGEQERARLVEADGESLVHGAAGRVVDGDHGCGGIDRGVPPGYRAVLSSEQLDARSRSGAG
jgi:hypothetical protein